jgi:hypothetical protein
MFMNPDLATLLARQQQRQMLAQVGHHQRRRQSSSFLPQGIMHRASARTAGRAACVLAALAIVLTATAIPAFARPAPPLNAGFTSTSAPAVVYPIAAGGMPGWQITVIAVGAAVTAAVAAVLLDRAWAARRLA